MAKQFHLADLFETVAATVPSKIALESDSLTLTYAELNARADRIASGLAANGVKHGDTVGIYLMNRAEHIEAFIAIVKLGAVPFNVNFRYREDELRYLFQNAAAAAVIHGAEFNDIMRALQPQLPDLKVSVSVEDGSDTGTAGLIAYNTLLESPLLSHFERSEDDILLIYTGGTTGMPKGVMWRHKAFVFGCVGGGGVFQPFRPDAGPARHRGPCRQRLSS